LPRICPAKPSGVHPPGKYPCAQRSSGGLPPRYAELGDTKSPQGRNASRAWLIAAAPNRILSSRSRRSQYSLPPLASQPLDSRQSLPAWNTGKPLTLRHLLTALRATPRRPKCNRQSLPPNPGPLRTHRTGPGRRATSMLTRPGWTCKPSTGLLDFDGCDAFELLLDGLGLVLGRILLQRLGSSVHQVLGFLQAE